MEQQGPLGWMTVTLGIQLSILPFRFVRVLDLHQYVSQATFRNAIIMFVAEWLGVMRNGEHGFFGFEILMYDRSFRFISNSRRYQWHDLRQILGQVIVYMYRRQDGRS